MSHYYWRRKTNKIVNNLPHTRKKDLTILAFALKMARGTPNAVIVALLLARRRRNFHSAPVVGHVPRETPLAKCAREFFAVIAGEACAPFRAKPRKDFVERKIALGQAEFFGLLANARKSEM